ncbi:uncharacterized protein PRCAT00000350001 [Priceomyces carsonii]|uniref:uncharacterized protein n=1 Tax=Priceomyces carsonii TaxID=28549 RepID=UPI002EDBA704|nr:unnamed protein product [Priceomyces carsonii]
MKGFKLLLLTEFIGLALSLAYLGSEEGTCNPRQDVDCLAINSGLAGIYFEPFTSRSSHFNPMSRPSNIEYTPEGLKMTIRKRLDNPAVVSDFHILHGKVEVEIKAAKGQGIISSFYLQSNDLDEIDAAEIFGGNPFEFQSNFFVKGNATTWDRGGYHPMETPPMNSFNKYAIEWTKEELVWLLNGRVVRVLKRDNPHKFPTSPMLIRFSLWAGGDPQNLKGTIDWAGGITDYSGLPYSMYIRNLFVEDYSTSKVYVYGNTDAARSIEIAGTNNQKEQNVPNFFKTTLEDGATTSMLTKNGTEGSYEDANERSKMNLSDENRFIQFTNNSFNSTNNSQTKTNNMSLLYILILHAVLVLLWF